MTAHRGQVDKVGKPYILHPLRVMMRLSREAEQIVAVLHDVVEDTPHTIDELRGLGYSEEILAALDCLTRRKDETYEQFVERLRPSPLARRVKLADLEDNMDLRRLAEVTEKDRARLARYVKAWSTLRDEK